MVGGASRSATACICASLAMLACEPAAPVTELLAPTYLTPSTALDLDLHAVDSKYIVGERGTLLVNLEPRSMPSSHALHGVLDCLVSGCSDYAVGEAGAVWMRAEGSGDWLPLDTWTSHTLRDLARVGEDIIVLGDDYVRVWNEWEGYASGFEPAPPDAAGWGRLHDYLAYTMDGDGGSIFASPDLHT